MKDLWLEIQIDFYLRLMRLFDRARRLACQRMTAAINRRSPGQVARMEQERGLT